MEKTFNELIKSRQDKINDDFLLPDDIIELLKQVREATLTECANVVSQDWVKTIDNIKRLPTDRIHEFEYKD